MHGQRFSLRQLLLAVALLAAVMAGLRFALRSHALSVGLAAIGAGAVVFLRIVSRLFEAESTATKQKAED
jgi:small neutral amino acid transporter SnatA (MarC family)